MALYDDYLAAAKQYHPEWDEETQKRWAESRAQSRTADDVPVTDPAEIYKRKREDGQLTSWNEHQGGPLDYLAKVSTEFGQDVSKRAHNAISDETAEKGNAFTKFADDALEVGGDILGGTYRALGSMPKFGFDAVGMLGGSSKWGYGDTKKRAQELQDKGVDSVNSWIMAIEEGAQKDNMTGSNDNVFAQTIDQIINNPIIGEGIGAIFKGLAKGTRAIGRAGKIGKVAEKATKSAGAVANVADDAAKVAKTGVVQGAKDLYKGTKSFFKDTKIGQKISNAVSGSVPYVTPIIDISRPLYKGIKTAASSGLRAGIAETIAASADVVGKFIANPYSYRLPRVFTYDQAQRFFGNIGEAYQTAEDQQKFYDDHGYALKNALSLGTDEELTKWYNEQGIPESKRLTIDELKKAEGDIGGSFINNFFSGMRDIIQTIDPWTYNQAYYRSVEAGETGTLQQTETSPRGRLRTSGGLNIDITDATITDDEGNVIDANNLTEEQKNDILEATLKFQSGDYSGLILESEYQQPDGSINITGLDQSNGMGQIVEGYVQNGMLTQQSVDMLMQGNKSADATNIVMNLNEASKEFTHQIVNLYTPEEINKNPELQGKILEQLGAYQRWFNEIANVINSAGDATYGQNKGGVYRYREAMTSALNKLSARDRDLINSNIYRQAIDYNNSLEEGISEKWMKAATSIIQTTDDRVVNKLLRDDDADVVDALGLAGLGNTAVNPNVVGAASMLGDVRAAVASNAAYLIDTAVVNFINNNLIEGYLGNLVSKGVMNKILPAKVLANKYYNRSKGFMSEAFSEPLENLLDAMTMAENADTNYDFMPGLLIGALQGGFAGYASSRSNYSTVKDYFSDPNNRIDIMSKMGIDINGIKDPQKKATMLAVTNQLFDNVIGVMADAYANSNYGVENLAQALAITLINNDMAEYATDVLDIANEVVNLQQEIANQTNNGERTDQQINDIFGSREMFNKYNNNENFSFSQTFIDNIRNGGQVNFNGVSSEDITKLNERISGLKQRFEAMSARAKGLVVASQSIKGNSLQEVFDKLAPKVDINGNQIKTPLTKEQKEAAQVMYDNLNPKTKAAEMYILGQLIAGANVEQKTIGDLLGIGEGSEMRDPKKGDFRKSIKVPDGDGKMRRISMRDYIIELLKPESKSGLTQEQKAFVANILTKTTVLGINAYFKDDGSLTRLGKDFFNSVMPAIEGSKSAISWIRFMNRSQTTKVTNTERSKNKALSERGSETHKNVKTIIVGGKPVTVGEKIEIDDRQIGNLTINGKPYTLRMLERDGEKTYVVNGLRKTISIKDGALDIQIESVKSEPSTPQEQTQEFKSKIDENGKFISAEDQRLDSLSDEEFEKEYKETEEKRKAARREYFKIDKDIKANPHHSESDAIDPRIGPMLSWEKKGYAMRDHLRKMDESRERRKKKNATQQQAVTQQQESVQQQKVENPDNIKTYGSKYVLDNMFGQSQIKDKYGHKVKSVYLTIDNIEDVDKSQLTLPPEGVDFMDYEIKGGDSGIHFIVDKQGNVYTVLDSGHFGSEHFFETGIVKKGDEGIDNDIIDFLESVNDSSLINEGWILKVDYDYYVKHKKAILDGTEKPNWKKIHKNFVDFIESRHQSSDNDDDDTTPPPASPAAPAVQEETSEGTTTVVRSIYFGSSEMQEGSLSKEDQKKYKGKIKREKNTKEIKELIGEDDFEGMTGLDSRKKSHMIEDGLIPDEYVYVLKETEDGEYEYVASTDVEDYNEAIRQMDEGYFSHPYRRSLLEKDIAMVDAADWIEVNMYKGIKQVRDKLLKIQQAEQEQPAQEQAQAQVEQAQEQEEKIEGDVEVTSSVEEKTAEEIKEDNGDTRSSGVRDDADVIISLTEKSNNLNKRLPIMQRSSSNVNIRLDGVDGSGLTLAATGTILGKEPWKYETDEELNMALNSDAAKERYQIVTITYKENGQTYTRQFYAVPQLQYAVNSPDLGEDNDKVNRALFFNSFVLLSTETDEAGRPLEYIEKTDSTIFRGPEEELTRPFNNYIYQVLDKDGNPVKENRVINFTQHYDKKTKSMYWRMATVVQLNRLSYDDRQRAYKSGKVFLTTGILGENGVRYEREVKIPTEDGIRTIRYDYRQVYTTSDMVMNPSITDIDIGNANIPVYNKKYSRADYNSQEELGGIADSQTPEELQAINEKLVIGDPTRASSKQEKEAVKELKQMDESYQETHEEAVNDAVDLTDDPNVSEEESINEHNKAIDPNIYNKARARLQMIASDGEGFPLGDYIDLELLSSLVASDDDPEYDKSLIRCIKDIDAIKNMSDTELYNFINKLNFLESRFEFLVGQGYYEDGYNNSLKVIVDLIGLIENDYILDRIDKITFGEDHGNKDFNGKELNDILPLFYNGYLPIELGISLDENGKIIYINYGNGESTKAHKKAVQFVHSHPNGSFFSPEDLGVIREAGFKKVGLILPGGVVLSFDFDDRFQELMYDETGEPASTYGAYGASGLMCDDIVIAIKFALDHGSFDQQQWGEYTDLANEIKEAYEKNELDENSLSGFALKATTIVKKIAGEIDMQLGVEAAASDDPGKYYMYYQSKLYNESKGYEEMTEEEINMIENMPDIIDDATKFNKAVVDNNSSLSEQTRSQILKDMKDLGLSLERLDTQTIIDIFTIYNSGKGIDELIKYLASKIRSGEIDNYLKNLLIKNGVLDEKGIYDGQSLDMAISLNGVKKLSKLKNFGNNLSDEEMAELKSEFENVNIPGYTKEQISDFVRYYMEAQIFIIKRGVQRADYKKKAVKRFKAVFKNFDTQNGSRSKLTSSLQSARESANNDASNTLLDMAETIIDNTAVNITEESVTKAVFVSNWIDDETKNYLITSIAKDIIENTFHMNYNNITEKFKNVVEKNVKEQLEAEGVMTLGNPYSDMSLKGNELIPQIEALPDEIRIPMAKAFKEKGLIGGTVYNYLIKNDPTATVLDQEGNITNGIISSVIIKSMDEILGTDKGTYVKPRHKLVLFLDIYRYYSLGGTSYEGLIKILREKYKNGGEGMNNLIDLLEQDMINSKNGLYDDTVINEVSKPTEYMDEENNPYYIFIRSENVSNPNSEDIIVEALLKLYNITPDSFFSIVKYAPLNIKSRITDYMRSENEKEHGSNKALGIVMSFLSSTRNKQILNEIAMQMAREKHTNTNLEDEVDRAVEKILTDWNDDSIIMNPAITELLYRETGIAQLDLTKGTVLYMGTKSGEHKPPQWETLDGKQTFPLKIVRNIDDVHAGVNIIVPEGKDFTLPAGTSSIHKIVRARVGIKNGLMVWAPITSYHNDDSTVGNIISGLGKMGYEISEQEGFVFTPEQERKLKQKRLTKNLYWKIFKEIIVPSLPGGKSTLSRSEFNKFITNESMGNTSYSLLKSVIASKSPDDKINAAIILINQVTNGQLALKTDILGSPKTIDIVSASEKFESEFISKLDPNSPTYERDKTLLYNFFTAYVATLLQLGETEEIEDSTGAGISGNSFIYLIQNHQAAIGLMKQIFDDTGYATSKYAYLPGENVLERNKEGFWDTMYRVFGIQREKVETRWGTKFIKGGIRRPSQKNPLKRLGEINKRLNEINTTTVKTDEETKRPTVTEIGTIKNEEIVLLENERDSIIRTMSMYEDERHMWVSQYAKQYMNGQVDLSGMLEKIEEQGEDITSLDEENEEIEVMDVDENTENDNIEEQYVESEDFQDKDAIVFATIFNNVIADNLYDMDGRTITYDEEGNNKFISTNLLSLISEEEGSAITSESKLELSNTESDIKDAKSNDDYKTILQIGDILALQTMISSNKSDEEELERILDWILQLPDGVSENDPVAILFNKTKEKIIRNPDTFASEMNKLVNNDLVNFDVYTGTMITTHRPNQDKIKGMAKKIVQAVYKFNTRPLSKEDLEEATIKLTKYFQDNSGKQITPAKDQIRLANEIVNLYDERNSDDKRQVIAPGFAGVGKSTTVVASLKAIKEQSGARSNDVERLQHGMKVISDNFFNDYKHGYQANKLYGYKKKEGPFYMKVTLNKSDKVGYIKFKGSSIKTHDELKYEYTTDGKFDEERFINDYTEKTNGAWTREGLLRLFEIGEGNDRGSRSRTRYMIEDFEYSDTPPTDAEFIDIDIHGLGNNIPSKPFGDGKYQGGTQKPIEGNGMIQGVYIFTKNKSTIQAINDLMQEENGLYGIQTATMDSNLVTYSSSTIPGIGYGAYPVIRSDKKLKNCLILIDETQGVDTATLEAIIDGYSKDNHMVFLGDPAQRSQNTIFKKSVDEGGDDMIQLTTVFRGPQDMQETNKLNNLCQNTIAESGYVMILPSDSENYKPYTDVTELFDLEGNTMYSARTNETVAKINAQFFPWAIEHKKPIPTMVIDAVTVNKAGQQVTDKGIINKRYHDGINIAEYDGPYKLGDKEFYFKIDLYNEKGEPSDIKIFVPLMPDTKAENVVKIKETIQEKYPKSKIEISTTAFAITTAKESGKTVDNLIMDPEITNPEYDIYADSNTKDAYDSFTRGSKRVYYPANASNVLFMPMSDIHGLVENNNPNITLSAPVAEITTTKKTIRFPRFYANDGARDAMSILGAMLAIAPEGTLDDEWVNTIITALTNISNTERLYNNGMLSTDVARGRKGYGDTWAEGNGEMLNGLKRQIAFKWNEIRDKVKKGMETDIKSINKFNKVDGWVYGKQIKIPLIEQSAMFTSFQVADSELTYETFTKGNKYLRNGDRGMFLIPTKTIDSKGKEVWTLKPAKIKWDTEERAGVLTVNNKNNKNQRIQKEIDKRIHEYSNAFDKYKNGDTKALLEISSMLASDLAYHTQDEDFQKKIDQHKFIRAQVGTSNRKYLMPEQNFPTLDPTQYLINTRYTQFGNQIKPNGTSFMYKTHNLVGENGEVNAVELWDQEHENDIDVTQPVMTGGTSIDEFESNLLGTKKNSIIRRLVEGNITDDLKDDLIDFVNTIYSIDYGLTTVGQYESMNSGETNGSAILSPYTLNDKSIQVATSEGLISGPERPEYFTGSELAQLNPMVPIDTTAAMEEADEQTSCKL